MVRRPDVAILQGVQLPEELRRLGRTILKLSAANTQRDRTVAYAGYRRGASLEAVNSGERLSDLLFRLSPNCTLFCLGESLSV